MANFLPARLVRAALAGLCLAAAATAQPAGLRTGNPGTDPDVLACAAGVYCRTDWSDQGLTPEQARLIMDLDEQQARGRLDEVTRQWPDALWRCAATGQACPEDMDQEGAQARIPMDPQGIAEVEEHRRRESSGDRSDETTRKRKKPALQVETPGPTQSQEPRNGIAVEVNEPGPSEITLRPPAQEIQPLDGTWSLVHGAMRSSGNCPAMLTDALGNVGSEADETRALTFTAPFHPEQFSGPEARWQRVAANHWRSLQSVEGGSLRVDLYVVNPSLMRGEIVIEMNIPSVCREVITTPYAHERQG